MSERAKCRRLECSDYSSKRNKIHRPISLRSILKSSFRLHQDIRSVVFLLCLTGSKLYSFIMLHVLPIHITLKIFGGEEKLWSSSSFFSFFHPQVTLFYFKYCRQQVIPRYSEYVFLSQDERTNFIFIQKKSIVRPFLHFILDDTM